MFLYRQRNVLVPAPVEITVAVIHNAQSLERVEHPRPMRAPGKLRRGLANGFGPEAGAGPVCDRLIERDAGYGNVDPGQVAGVFAPHKRMHAGIGGLNT